MRVPSNVAAGRGSPFPQGVFLGSLGEVTTRWSDDQKNMDVILTFAENTPFDEDSPNVGARTKRQRVTLIFQGQALVDVEEFTDDVHVALQRSATLLTQTALALGFATLNEDKSVDIDLEAFLEQLTNNVFKGEVVVFEVRHRGYASREAQAAAKASGKKVQNDRISDDVVSIQAALDKDPAPAETFEEAAGEEATPTPAAALSGLRKRS